MASSLNGLPLRDLLRGIGDAGREFEPPLSTLAPSLVADAADGGGEGDVVPDEADDEVDGDGDHQGPGRPQGRSVRPYCAVPARLFR